MRPFRVFIMCVCVMVLSSTRKTEMNYLNLILCVVIHRILACWILSFFLSFFFFSCAEWSVFSLNNGILSNIHSFLLLLLLLLRRLTLAYWYIESLVHPTEFIWFDSHTTFQVPTEDMIISIGRPILPPLIFRCFTIVMNQKRSNYKLLRNHTKSFLQ